MEVCSHILVFDARYNDSNWLNKNILANYLDVMWII